MSIDVKALMWLFPVAFVLHDLEELVLFEPWLKKNAEDIREKIRGKAPAFVERQIEGILGKTTGQFAVPMGLILLLVCLATVLAAGFGLMSLFLLAGSLFFLHGFMHIGQAVLLRRYVPALVTSIVVVLPYGIVLFWRLVGEGMVSVPILLLYFGVSLVLTVPFILGMHAVGEKLVGLVVKLAR